MRIKVKYHADIPHLERLDVGDWVDLRAAEDIICYQNVLTMIPLGVSMKLPEGYEAIIAPRSSTFKHHGIIMTNSIGVIDNSYSGTNDIWHFPAVCIIPERTWFKDGVCCSGSLISKGERICQFRIQPRMGRVVFDEVEELDDEDRGGFGSTGRE